MPPPHDASLAVGRGQPRGAEYRVGSLTPGGVRLSPRASLLSDLPCDLTQFPEDYVGRTRKVQVVDTQSDK